MWSERRLWVKGRRGRRADGTAGLPPAPEIAGAFRHLRFVPTAEVAQMVISHISCGGSAPAKEVTNGGQEKEPDTGSHQSAKQVVFARRKIDDRAMRIEWKNPSRFRQVGRWPVSVVKLPDKKR
jgi:hypothetical protein